MDSTYCVKGVPKLRNEPWVEDLYHALAVDDADEVDHDDQEGDKEGGACSNKNIIETTNEWLLQILSAKLSLIY